MRNVLYVDDEPALCKAFERALRAPEYQIVTTTSAPEALSLIDGGLFDVVATDYRMPGIDGLDLLRLVRERSPGTARLLISGQGEDDVEPTAIRDAGVDYIVTKPWSLDELRKIVRDAAERAFLQRENQKLRTALTQQERKIIEVLEKALVLRFPARRAHAQRTARIARTLGESLGLDSSDISSLERAALLHELGALVVPIFVDPSTATHAKAGSPSRAAAAGVEVQVEDEAEAETEAGTGTDTDKGLGTAQGKCLEHGASLLEGFAELESAKLAMLQQGERWDGTGFPAHLAGERICLGARILAVAHAYDLLRSDAAGKEIRPHIAVVAELDRDAGRLFDPAVLAALAKMPDC
ncbi:MAG: HD domain-containing phosphohydrolase [Pseudomonadota bacterium]